MKQSHRHILFHFLFKQFETFSEGKKLNKVTYMLPNKPNRY